MLENRATALDANLVEGARMATAATADPVTTSALSTEFACYASAFGEDEIEYCYYSLRFELN